MSYNVLPAVPCCDGAIEAAFSGEKMRENNAEPCLLRFILRTHSGSHLTETNFRTIPEPLCECSGKVKQQGHKVRSNGNLQVSQMQVTMVISLSFACRNHQPCCRYPAACLSTGQLICTPWPGPTSCKDADFVSTLIVYSSCPCNWSLRCCR